MVQWLRIFSVNAEDTNSIPGLGRFPQVPELLKPSRSRAYALHQGKSLQEEAQVLQRRVASVRQQLEKACSQRRRTSTTTPHKLSLKRTSFLDISPVEYNNSY